MTEHLREVSVAVGLGSSRMRQREAKTIGIPGYLGQGVQAPTKSVVFSIWGVSTGGQAL